MPFSCSCQELQALPFFSALTDRECAAMMPYLETEVFEPGELVVREGMILARMFLVVRGMVRQEKILGITMGASGLEAWQEKEVFESIGPGQHFCAEVLVEQAPVNADWVALEKCELISLSATAFQEIRRKYVDMGARLEHSLCLSLHGSLKKQQGRFHCDVENKKLLGQMRIERKKIKAMHRIARSTAVSNVNQTLDTILEACMACLDVEKGSIMITDRGLLRVEAAFGANKDKILGQMQVINDGSVSGRCFLSRKPVFTQDIEQEQGLRRSPDPSQYRNNSLISMPLISHGGESIGVLNVSKTSLDVFTEDDMKILEDLTLEASAALAHEISLARLYRNFQETYVEVRRIRKQLLVVEERICGIMSTSWPAQEEKGVPAHE
ncbi:MAG: GAF domain-containing protein [Deltaproteobacteria bacterium]|nr:GAF domain-containing protein [Deltaproteobacteria bacterium]